jgi:hypothetical protein
MIEVKITEENVARIKLSLTGFVDGVNKAAKELRKLIQKMEEDKILKEQLESIAIATVKPRDTKDLLEFLSKLSKEFKEIQGKIEDKNKLRQSWKYSSYRSKFNSRIQDKRTLYHNCRNNC